VDVILRLVFDAYCDPLELRGDSLLGIPGLLQAARGGHVAIANAIGSGLAENPGLAAFLPLLCQQLLGETLRLPSLPTWWCGASEARGYVLNHLDQLVIRSILPGQPHWEVARLDAAARAQLVTRIQAAPHLFVGQESLPLSTAPVLEDGRLTPRPVMLRGFTVADGAGYRVMPGGLARVSSGLDTLQSTLQQGGISKDWWVLAPTPQKHVSLLRQSYGPIFVTRDGGDLPSRVADNLFWLGRYSERLDSTARLLRKRSGGYWNGSRTIRTSAVWTICWKRWKSRCRRWRNRPAPVFFHPAAEIVESGGRVGSSRQPASDFQLTCCAPDERCAIIWATTAGAC
jgi:hypothetical protein